jgi:hypothetical protein
MPLALAAMLGLGGCGGGSPAAPGAPPQNAFTGTLVITSALPSGTTTCQGTQTVTFTASGATPHLITVAGGDCVSFLNSDTAAHRPAQNGTSGCPELDAAASLAAGASFPTPPLGGPRTCYWRDALNPPAAGGGGGAGY